MKGKKEGEKRGKRWGKRGRITKKWVFLFQITSRLTARDSGQSIAGDNTECGGEHKGSWNLIAQSSMPLGKPHRSGMTTIDHYWMERWEGGRREGLLNYDIHTENSFVEETKNTSVIQTTS